MESTAGLTRDEQSAILHLAATAALQDPALDERDRRVLLERRERFGHPGNREPAEAWAAAAGRLRRAAAAELAFDAALAACSADGLRGDAETRFLAQLGRGLGLTHPTIVWHATMADGLATAPFGAGPRRPSLSGDTGVVEAATQCAALALTGQPLAALATVAVELRLLHRLLGPRATDARAARQSALELGGGPATHVVDVVDAQLHSLLADTGDDTAGRLAARRAYAHAYALGQRALRLAEAEAGLPREVDVLAEGTARFAAHAPEIEALAARIDPLRLLAFVREGVTC